MTRTEEHRVNVKESEKLQNIVGPFKVAEKSIKRNGLDHTDNSRNTWNNEKQIGWVRESRKQSVQTMIFRE